MEDFLGYQRTGNPRAQIISSEFAKITIGGQISLIQSFSATYQHDVRPVYEVGTSQIRWVTGHPRGQMQVSRIVGNTGFFQAFGGGGDCGHLSTIAVSATRGPECTNVNVSTNSRIRFSGAILQGINVNIQAGRVEVIEGASILFTGLELN